MYGFWGISVKSRGKLSDPRKGKHSRVAVLFPVLPYSDVFILNSLLSIKAILNASKGQSGGLRVTFRYTFINKREFGLRT